MDTRKYELYLAAAAMILIAAIVLYVSVFSPALTPVKVINSAGLAIPASTSALPHTQKGTVKNQDVKININTASKDELISLPGIGEATAKKIIEYRKKYGFFANTADIKNVSGIGEAKYDDIKNYIKVRN
ncbi:MAG: hypothetical protein BGN88_05095 [Clostridiales bacterium 43-6]|nr:MAG: hypothetical protein BGN88_05095 [Clostridiales bacterium 43-6]